MKRKSIGNDPLDWIGERSGQGRPSGGAPAAAPAPAAADAGREWPGPAQEPKAGAGADTSMIPLAAPSTAMALERQLLLVDSLIEDGRRRPRVNQILAILLVLVTVLGMSALFFREARRHWDEQVQTMEGTIERIEKEKGRNERILEQVIGEKDLLIREKQGTISKIEAIHQSLAEELRIARTESSRLKEENRSLMVRFLDAPRRDAAGRDPAARVIDQAEAHSPPPAAPEAPPR